MLDIGKALDVGIKRRGKKNQDNLAVVFSRSSQPLLIVADGMGGYQGGEIASKIVIRTLTSAFRLRKRKKSDRPGLLTEAIKQAHAEIMEYAQEYENLQSMGSTVVAVAIHVEQRKALVANVGDSRAYLITKDSIRLVSHDHSEVADLERKGALTPVEARDYVRKNVLTMSLAAHRPAETVKPFSAMLPFEPGSVILLCSDGLWGVVPDALIRAIAMEYPPQQAAEKLVELANASGGPDNISVIIARRKGEWEKYRAEDSIDMEDTFSGKNES